MCDTNFIVPERVPTVLSHHSLLHPSLTNTHILPDSVDLPLPGIPHVVHSHYCKAAVNAELSHHKCPEWPATGLPSWAQSTHRMRNNKLLRWVTKPEEHGHWLPGLAPLKCVRTHALKAVPARIQKWSREKPSPSPVTKQRFCSHCRYKSVPFKIKFLS